MRVYCAIAQLLRFAFALFSVVDLSPCLLVIQWVWMSALQCCGFESHPGQLFFPLEKRVVLGVRSWIVCLSHAALLMPACVRFLCLCISFSLLYIFSGIRTAQCFCVLGLYCDYFKRMPMFFWRLAYYIPFTVLRHCNFVTCVFLRICSLLHVFSVFLSVSAISFSVHLDVNFHCLQLMHTFSAFSHDFLTAPGLLYWFVRFSLRMRTFFGVCERFSYCSSFFSAQLFSSYFLRIRGIYFFTPQTH